MYIVYEFHISFRISSNFFTSELYNIFTISGERLIQYATENLVTEVLIHPQMNTLLQCLRNLLSSFTRHRHIIHAGYTFAGNGSWIMQVFNVHFSHKLKYRGVFTRRQFIIRTNDRSNCFAL